MPGGRWPYWAKDGHRVFLRSGKAFYYNFSSYTRKLLSLQKATVGTHEFGETLAVVPGLKVSEQEVRAVIQELGSEDTVETTKLIEALTVRRYDKTNQQKDIVIF